jgi:hypothetical protein
LKKEAEAGPCLDKAVSQLVEAVLKSVEEGKKNPMLPFEVYLERIQLETQDDAKEFRLRLRKGYLAILNAIRNKKDMSQDDKKEIVKNILSILITIQKSVLQLIFSSLALRSISLIFNI